MEISLSPETEEKARQIPNLAERVESFIASEFELQKRRESRYPSKVESIVQRALVDGEKLRKSGAKHEDVVDEIVALNEKIGRQVHGG